jgi:hypothetical protein
MSQDQAEQNIQMWKVKKLIKSLDSARGCVRDLESYFLGVDTHFGTMQGWHFHDQSHNPSKSM